MFAFTEGTLSACCLAQLYRRDLPYQLLCGGIPVTYHALADFYSDNHDALRQLFVELVAILRQQGLIDLHTVTVDGRKVPANASKDHFRREGTLQTHLEQAHLEQLEQQLQDQPTWSAAQISVRRRAARYSDWLPKKKGLRVCPGLAQAHHAG